MKSSLSLYMLRFLCQILQHSCSLRLTLGVTLSCCSLKVKFVRFQMHSLNPVYCLLTPMPLTSLSHPKNCKHWASKLKTFRAVRSFQLNRESFGAGYCSRQSQRVFSWCGTMVTVLNVKRNSYLVTEEQGKICQTSIVKHLWCFYTMEKFGVQDPKLAEIQVPDKILS